MDASKDPTLRGDRRRRDGEDTGSPGEEDRAARAPLVPAFAARSDPGRVRERNEDHYAVIRHDRRAEILSTNLENAPPAPAPEQAYLFLVGDGLGGAAFGDVASAAALRMIWEMGVEEGFWPTRFHEDSLLVLRERGTRSVQRIHEALAEHGARDPEYRGMGTTITAAYVLGDRCFITHVGDSRAYRIRGERILQITKDHTMGQRLRDDGIAVDDPTAFAHILTNCLGGDLQPAKPDFNACRFENGDVLLLCTDGLTDVIEDAELLAVLREASDPERAADTLLAMTLQRGAPDNVTLIVARFEDRRA